MVTTIQLNESVKKVLDSMKESRETYEDVIVRLMKDVGNQKEEREKLLIEGYKEMAEESLILAKEGEGVLMDGLDKNEEWNDF